MIRRIVKMTFRPDEVETFKTIFESSCDRIRAFGGCNYLELLQDSRHPNVFFTLSTWEREEDLEAYRQSDLFRTTWESTRALFDERAQAWSTDTVKLLP